MTKGLFGYILNTELQIENFKNVKLKTKKMKKKDINNKPNEATAGELNLVSTSTTEKVRHSDDVLSQCKDLLLDELAAAKAAFDIEKDINTNVNGTEDTGHKFSNQEGPQVQQSQNNQDKVLGRMKKKIQETEDALLRIKNKTYGICKVTGELIPVGRLLKNPCAETVAFPQSAMPAIGSFSIGSPIS